MEIKTIVYGLIVVFVLVVTLFAYNSASKNPKEALFKIIDWFAGEKEFDYSQANKIAKTYFNNPDDANNDMIAKLEKCRDSEINNCDCDLDLNGFSEIHSIEVNKDKLVLYYNRVYEHSTSKIKESEISFSNLNCVWKNKNKNEVHDFEIIFKKEDEVIVPKLFYEVNWGFDYEGDLANIELYKSNGKLCWIDANSEGFGEMQSCI